MTKPWLASYADGIPAEIDLDPNATLVSVMDESFARFHDRPAYASMGRTLSFADVDRLSADFAAWLQGIDGLEKGSRVAVMLPNLLQYPVCLFGVLRAGMVVVNVNPLYTARELRHQLSDSGAQCIVTLANFAHVVQEVVADTQVRTVVVTEVGDMLAWPKRWLVNAVVRRKAVPAWHLPGHHRFRDALAAGARRNRDPVSVAPSDLAFLQYTGGTTGLSKGAMLSHGNVVANLEQTSLWLSPVTEDGKEIVITALPLYHIFALVCNCLAFMRAGGLNVLIANPRDVQGFVKELARWPYTTIFGVNTLFNALLADEDFAALDFSTVKLSLGGGMAVQRATADRWKDVTGCTLGEGYGLTETSPVVTMNPLSADMVYTGAVGLPLPSTEVAIRDDDGQDLAVGERGELCVRGPQVMQGYWQRPEATDAVMYPDGFLRTGDVATMDDAGYVRIVDRKKDMILVSGFNVYPNEVEDIVAHHPAVLEAACIGVPDPVSTEQVKVVVVARPGATVTAEEIVAHCRESLTAYKVPKFVEFRDELPKTNVGKILRRALREESPPA